MFLKIELRLFQSISNIIERYVKYFVSGKDIEVVFTHTQVFARKGSD